MKNILFIAAALALLLTACSAPAEQIVVIPADSTPMPAVTPVLTSSPSSVPTAGPVTSPSSLPTTTQFSVSTPNPTAVPTASPTAAPTVKPTAEHTPEPPPVPTVASAESADASDFGGDVLALVNSYRNAAGLSSLKYSSAMQKAADTRAKECASSFSHTRPDGSKAYTALTERGVSFTAFGENIFAASGMSSVSAEYVVEQWMASQGHRDNILRDGFTHMCIGVASQDDEVYVVQLFGAGIS